MDLASRWRHVTLSDVEIVVTTGRSVSQFLFNLLSSRNLDLKFSFFNLELMELIESIELRELMS